LEKPYPSSSITMARTKGNHVNFRTPSLSPSPPRFPPPPVVPMPVLSNSSSFDGSSPSK